MNAREPRIREIIGGMIDQFAASGEVDIAYEFGRVFPVRVFLDLMGFPFTMFEQFLDWEWNILHEDAIEKKAEALRGVLAYLRGFIADKQADPDDTLGSYIANGSIDGKQLTEDEVIGMTWFLWLGGLDTVASTVSQMFRRLAIPPELQTQIREAKGPLNSAVEEFLRPHPPVQSGPKGNPDI